MRSVCWLAVLGLVAVAGCGEDEASPFVNEFNWQVYCSSTEIGGGCSSGERHEITGFNKDDNIAVACAVSGGNMTATITDLDPTSPGAVTVAGASESAGTCRVTVREGTAVYQDSCANSTSIGGDGKGCTFTGVGTGDTFEGSIQCTNLVQAAAGASAAARSLSSDAATRMRVNIQLANCD